MKKKLLALGTCTALLASVAFAACGSGGANNALKAEDAYGLGAVSAVKLLGGSLSAKAIGTFAAVSAETAADEIQTSAETEIKSQAEKFNEYFTALDSFLGEDLVSTSTTANTDENYPFETKMTVKGRDFDGDETVYTMYYTETLVKEKTETDKNDGETETEAEYVLEGVMVLNGVDYYLTGERSYEEEKDETENELEIRAYADKNDKLNYVQMKQETSNEIKNNKTENEIEYVYSVYSNGKLVEETAVEFETERKSNGKEETEYELEFRKGEAKGEYKVVREAKTDKVEIKVEYKIDGRNGVFRICEKTDDKGNKYYEYTFSDNSTVTYPDASTANLA